MGANIRLIGIDGGATKVSGWSVDYDSDSQVFTLGTTNVQHSYAEYADYQPSFSPVDIKSQLDQFNRGPLQPAAAEIRQGRAYVQACADVIIELAHGHQGTPLVGIGMPGLKTGDDRGIAVLLNGPRIPDYASRIETILSRRGIDLLAPVARLGSDADYCGLGEEYSADGNFRPVDNAYYLGGGTGAADALKLAGELVPLDHTKPWLAKTWEMQNDQGLSLERFASAGGIQSVYSRYCGLSVKELNSRAIYPDQILQMAQTGDQPAQQTFADVAEYLAGLLFERLSTIYSGWKNQFSFTNTARPTPNTDHDYRGLLLERIVIGQRLGNLLEQSKQTDFFYRPLLAHLTNLTESEAPDDKFHQYYSSDTGFPPEKLVTSGLRAAPAMGAGIDAWLHYQGDG